MPSPIFTRKDGDVLALLAQRQLEGQLLLLLVHHQHGPGLGGDELLDLGHDELDDLARLQDRVGGLHDVGEDGQALRDLLELLAGPAADARAPPRGPPGARRAAGACASTGSRPLAATRHPRPQSATSTGRRCSFTPPLMPTALTTTTWRPAFASLMNSLKVPSRLHVHALAVHGHGGPGLGAPLDLQDVRAHVEGLDDERRRRAVALAAPVGRATVKREKSENLPVHAVLVHRGHPPVVLAGVQPAQLDRALLDAAAVHQRPVEVRAVVEQHVVGRGFRHRLPGQQRDGAGGVGVGDLGLVGGRSSTGTPGSVHAPARPCRRRRP